MSTLIKWFPDRPGLATGMAIMGFGGGALIASPVSTALLKLYDPNSGAAGWVASGDAVGRLFLTLAVVYLAYMLFGAFTIRVRNVTAGIGILEQAAPMIQDFFGQPDGVSLVSAAVASGFVGLLSIGNMSGRFAWSATSDVTGRKRIYMVYLGVGAVLYTVLALAGSTTTFLYVALAFVIISFYGGGFATVPAYLRDLFGTFQVGTIHGRLLTAWSAAGIAGPLIVNAFLDAQGKPGQLDAASYQPALLTMVGLLVIGFVANLLVKPVHARFHEPRPERERPMSTAHTPGAQAPAKASTGRLGVAWALVGVPLAYGVYQTLTRVGALFG